MGGGHCPRISPSDVPGHEYLSDPASAPGPPVPVHPLHRPDRLDLLVPRRSERHDQGLAQAADHHRRRHDHRPQRQGLLPPEVARAGRHPRRHLRLPRRGLRAPQGPRHQRPADTGSRPEGHHAPDPRGRRLPRRGQEPLQGEADLQAGAARRPPAQAHPRAPRPRARPCDGPRPPALRRRPLAGRHAQRSRREHQRPPRPASLGLPGRILHRGTGRAPPPLECHPSARPQDGPDPRGRRPWRAARPPGRSGRDLHRGRGLPQRRADHGPRERSR